MKNKIKDEINFLKQNNDKILSWGLVFVTLVLFVYCYFGSFSFFESTFTAVSNLNYWKIIYHNFMAFVLFFVLGSIFTKTILKNKLSRFGFGVGNWKFGLKLIAISILVVPLLALFTTTDAGMSSTYPLINFNIYSSWWEILLYFLSYIAYYVGWEYLFRGILLFSSEGKIGTMGSILLTTLISSLIHTSIAGFGKPMLETMSAIPAGLIFGYTAVKTRSIYYSLFMHALIGILTDVFIFII